eukprot:8325668-Pyramimonas_sp.AAC.1
MVVAADGPRVHIDCQAHQPMGLDRILKIASGPSARPRSRGPSSELVRGQARGVKQPGAHWSLQ